MADISFPVYGEVYAKNGDKIAPNTLKVEQGWVQEMMPFQYENWLQNRQDVAITYLLQKGIPEYNAAQEYVANKSVVLYVGVVYLATTSGLLDLPTDTSQWRKLSVTLDSNGIVPVVSGGTGASTPSQARTNLGLGTASTLNADFVVQKDGAGNFSAGTITATLAGNATTSSSWLTGRTISLSGAVTGTSSAWKGDGNLTITTTSLDATTLAGEVPSASLPLVVKKSSDTGIAYIPMGTTPERPATPTAPGTRINSTTGMMEFWNGSAWISITGGAESYFSAQLQTKVDRTSTTGAAILPEGTDAERPVPGTSGFYVRLNKTSGNPEWYNRSKSAWQSIINSGELFDYSWHNGSRSNIDAGRVPTDGQQLFTLTHPDVCQAIWDGKQHAVDESVWQSDPTKRNCWSRGDGTSWVRVPDLNAVVAGTGNPFYLRGGSDALNGTSVGDAIRDIIGNAGVVYAGAGYEVTGPFASDASVGNLTTDGGRNWNKVSFRASRAVPTADENRVKTAYGVWTVRVFTEVRNVGALDAGQLATQLAVVDANTGFTIIYPNGGTQASPAIVAINSRYVESNPFAGFPIMCSVEFLYGGEWSEVKMGGSGTVSYGADAGQNNNSIVLVTGTQHLITAAVLHYFSGVRPAANLTTGLPCRIKVWKLKGDV